MLSASAVTCGLDRTEILVVYNANFPGSKELAEYYVARRQIPKEHVLAIRTDQKERIARKVYLDTIQKPMWDWVDRNKKHDKIRCVLLMRGVPLAVNRIEAPEALRARDDAALAVGPFTKQKKDLEEEKKRLQKQADETPARAAALRKQIETLDAKIAEVDRLMKPLEEKHHAAAETWKELTEETEASVDSELALLLWDGGILNPEALKMGRLVLHRSDSESVKTKMWVRNLLNHRTWKMPERKRLPRTLMVCRLDAATDALVKRIIDDSIAVEQKGLEGVAYFDAQGKRIPPAGKVSFYDVYDELIRRGAALVEKSGIKTVVDNQKPLFGPGSCPNAALYCGWWSLREYVPAFTWVKGSVGFHVASAEGETLRGEKTQAWCKRMVDEGVAATFGPVNEPYLQSFPNPSHFFAFLLTGQYTVAEAFWYSSPMNSWMQTLIADPLYTPFLKNPKMSITELTEALKPKPLRRSAPGETPQSN